MNRSTRWALAAVAGASMAIVFLGVHAAYSLFETFNRKACDDQAPLKVLNAKLSMNGNSSYDPQRELCVYKYINSNSIPDEITWKP